MAQQLEGLLDPVEVERRKAALLADLDGGLDNVQIVQRRIIYGLPLAIDAEAYMRLKHDLAHALDPDLHPSSLAMVGSAKLGFSIKPTRFMQPFCDVSDIDMAVVSDALFTRVWSEVFSLTEDQFHWEDEAAFKKYLFRGWIRPDMMPLEAGPHWCTRWHEALDGINASGQYGPYPVKVGLYHSWHFLERYQCRQIQYCRDQRSMGKL